MSRVGNMGATAPRMRLDAARIESRATGRWIGEASDVASIEMRAIEIDSRACAKDSLFVALAGASADGHDFVRDAAANGACAALVQRDIEGSGIPLYLVEDVMAALARLGAAGRAAHRRAGGRLAAITGSVGKTGSKEMLAHAVTRLAGHCHASRASYNNDLGVPLTLAALPETDIPAVQEIGMNAPGEIARLAPMARPDVAMITRIADSHAEFFDGIEDIAEAKSEIFEGLAEGGVAVINGDDVFHARLAARAKACGADETITFGCGASCDFRLLEARTVPDGLAIRADLAGRPTEFALGMRAVHWAHNAMGVLACIEALGMDAARAAGELHDFRDLPGRGAVVNGRLGGARVRLVDDSYNAGPASMRAALVSLGDMPAQIMLLSDMLELGAASQEAHAALAPLIADIAPRLVVTMGDAMAHMAGALPASTTHIKAKTGQDAARAVESNARDGDVVFVKGSLGSGAHRAATALRHAMQSGAPAMEQSHAA